MKFRILISLALVYQANPWEIYDPPRGSGPRWNYVSPPWTQPSSSSVVFRRPMDAMVDLTNDLGVAILQDYSYSRSNFAFSPYGVASVLVVLYEGARGESARQIHTAVKFPWDRDITRIGFRDIHRHLRSYFSHEGYLSGITLNKEGTALKPEYKRVLRFYGYDVDIEPPESTAKPPKPTTNKMTEVPLVTRTTTTTTAVTTTTTTTTTEAASKLTTTLKPETTTTTPAPTTTSPAAATTTAPNAATTPPVASDSTTSEAPGTESPKPKEEETTTSTEKATTPTTVTPSPTTSRPTTTTAAPTTTTTTPATTTTTPKPETPTELPSSSSEESSSEEAGDDVQYRNSVTTTEKEITIPDYSEATTQSPDEMRGTTAAEDRTEKASESTEPDDSQNTTPKDINIDNGMLIPQPEGVTPLSVHTDDSQQLPSSNSSAESRLGADDLVEENEFRNTETTLAATETTTMEAETTQMFEMKKRSPISDDKNYLWEAKTLDEYLMQKRNDGMVEDETFVNTDAEISIKSLEEYLSLKEAERKSKNLRPDRTEVSFRPGKAEGLLNRKRKQMTDENNRPISFQTNLGLRNKKMDRERRTISDFLKIPPVPDLSLQLQNGMFDSHVSRGADLYRTLPRNLFLVDGAVDTPVPVMSYSSVFPYAYIPRLHSTALEFPLDDERYKLLIILPVERRGLRQLMYDLSACPLRQVLESLRPTRVKATVPTFMVEGFVILTPTLQKLGIWDVFDPRRSNLSGMSTDPELYVRNIEQSVTVVIRNYVEILDIQTRTMAARGVEQEFTATHPFLYFVLDTETNVALMAGQILDPLNSRIY